HDLRELLERGRLQRGGRRPYARRANPAAPPQDLLAQRDRGAGHRARLALVADERQPLIEDAARVVATAGHEVLVDHAQRLGIRESRHGADGAARELLEEIDAAEAAEDRHLAPAELAQSRDLGRRGRFLELEGLRALP